MDLLRKYVDFAVGDLFAIYVCLFFVCSFVCNVFYLSGFLFVCGFVYISVLFSLFSLLIEAKTIK